MAASMLVLVIVKLVGVMAYICYVKSMVPRTVPTVYVVPVEEVDANRW